MKIDEMRRFFGLCLEHFEHAKEKHPKAYALKFDRDAVLAHELKAAGYKRDGGEDGQWPAVLYAEVEEFLAEVADGNRVRAISEAADVAAVLMRLLDQMCRKELAQRSAK